MVKKEKACMCKMSGSGMVGHILVLVGLYLFVAGLAGTYAWKVVLGNSVFWGLFLILSGFCAFAAAKCSCRE
jgi:hypothetical protein